MKDIKSLYLDAKINGREADVIAYQEAVNNAFNNDPSKYVLQLEYIISSSIGIDTFIPFIEKYGLPISLFEKACKCISDTKKKLEDRKEDTDVCVKVENYLNEFHEKYSKCFAMHDYLIESNSPKYIENYYSYTNGKPNRILIKGMYETYGMESVMDSMITANQLGKNAVNTAANYFTKVNNDIVFNEVLHIAFDNLDVDDQYVETAYNNSMSFIVNNVLQRNHQIFRESVITDNDNMMYEYSKDEIDAIKEMISFKEYCICAADDLGISINEYQSEIMSLYEELDGIIDEDGADLVEMLPQSNIQYAKENIFKPTGTWIANTRDKKTGNAPTYLSQNHDMINYGEDDNKPQSDIDEEENQTKEKSLDDYKRPSSIGSKPSTASYLDNDKDSNEEENKENKEHNKMDSTYTQPVSNNYYYYTYTNSMNKNSNSFNKDNSLHDNHSTHNSSDNHSLRYSDDHSNNKRIKSDDYNHAEDENVDDDKKPYEKLENSDPWSINIFNKSEIITEADDMVGDADNDKPKSDHPIKDALMDIDRKTVKFQQGAKKVVQDATNVGKAAVKPVKRTINWVGKMIGDYKDANETNIKEKLADPYSRANIFSAAKKAITVGALYKAGILLNPAFLFLAVTNKVVNNQKTIRIRDEMIGEIKQEIAIIKDKIEHTSDDPEGKAAKYKLMRLKNELEKKLLRVVGGKRWAKII